MNISITFLNYRILKIKTRKLHFMNPRGKFILSLEEKRQGPKFKVSSKILSPENDIHVLILFSWSYNHLISTRLPTLKMSNTFSLINHGDGISYLQGSLDIGKRDIDFLASKVLASKRRKLKARYICIAQSSMVDIQALEG